MEVAGSLISSQSLRFYGHPSHQPLQYKVSLCNRYFLCCIAKTLPLSSSFRNGFTSLQSHENQCQKSNDTLGLLGNTPIIDVSSANNMIQEYTDNGLFEDAIKVYVNLLECGFPPEEFRFFPCLVKAFGGLSKMGKGEQIHGHLLKLGFLDDVYVSNSVLGMYWKYGEVELAIKMFQGMLERDLVSWNTMVSGFCQAGDFVNSLTLFSRMVKEYGGAFMNRVAYLCALSSCASMKSLVYGRMIHGILVKNGLESDEFLVSGLIEMYMKCKDIKNAEHVFRRNLDNELVRKNGVVWNVRISGYIFNGHMSLALKLFVEMLELGVNPDSSTVVAVLVLCTQLLDITVGEQIHRIVVGYGLERDVRVGTALIEMYFKCGDPEAGLRIFKRSQSCNLVMWGSVIINCAQNGYPNEALQFFHDFMLDYGVPDIVILLAALRACSTLALKSAGMCLHGLAVKMGFDCDVFVGGALVDLYGQCADMVSAQSVFCYLATRDLVSWNALISGFAQNEFIDEALNSFRNMQSERMKPNAVTLACILSVCAQLSVTILCKEVHCFLLRHGFESNVLVSNALISAYAKCGDMNSSWTLFEKMPGKNQISWNSILLGFGMHGRADEMFALFEKMIQKGIKPDHATFTALLSACSHTGKIEMAWKYFKCMVEDYNLEPRIEQYTCMVDLLGRAGHLKLAYDIIKSMPFFPDDRIWGSLLGSCKKHGDANLAEVVAIHIFELDPTSIGYRVLLANLYEDFGKWNEVTRIRSVIKREALKKQPGCSWIEIGNSIHVFTAGDHSHRQNEQIYSSIESLTLEMKRMGYTPCSQSANVCADETQEGWPCFYQK